MVILMANHTEINACKSLPIIYSRGIFSGDPMPFNYALPVVHMQALVIMVTTQAWHFVLRRFGLSEFVSQIIAGIILSPSILGGSKIFRNLWDTPEDIDILLLVCRLGFLFYMFESGVKMDISMTFRTGWKAWALGIGSILVPVSVGMGFTFVVTRMHIINTKMFKWPFYVVAMQSFSSFPVIAHLLHDLKLVNSELGRLGLSAALISDLCGTLLNTIVRFVLSYTSAPRAKDLVLKNAGITVAILLAIFFIARPVMLWVVRRMPEGKPIQNKYICVLFMAMFGFTTLTGEFTGTVYLGSYLLGLVVPAGPPLGSTLVRKIESFSVGVLMPLFASASIIRADTFGKITGFKLVSMHSFNISLVAIIFISKFLVAVRVSRHCNLPYNDSVAIALIMNYKGVFELSAFALAATWRRIPAQAFPPIVVASLINAAAIPVLLKILYNPSRKYAGYQRRNIMNLKPNSELKILACIHRPDNIASTMGLIDFCHPTTESPITANVIHLIELIGRSSPIFIPHKSQSKSVYENSYSAAVVRSFHQYEESNVDVLSVNVYTAVSPPNLMQEDICTLALDKLTSFIVLPFHRKWYADGHLETESTAMRTLNCSVLDTAPCSVGILIDHGQLTHLASRKSREFLYHVQIIFMGGKDDREALTLARRMAEDPQVKLTLIRLNYVSANSDDDMEKKIDTELITQVKLDSYKMQNIAFKEEPVADGEQVISALRSLVDECNIFIVGRNHSLDSCEMTGLPDWCEFPELGFIGDLLASSEFNSKASVLIVQQQYTSESTAALPAQLKT